MKFKLSLLTLALTCCSVQADDKPIQKDENEIEKLIITATPLSRTVLESATPVTVLGGEQLDQHQASTLGETLKNIPGVHSSYFGPTSSSPVIRGLDGPRIKVVQNGLDSSDAPRVGPDHAVTTEAFTATQIEVLRGPATLLYGSGAIGGVVNVVDNRIPRSLQDELTGEVIVQGDSVSDGHTMALDLNGSSNQFGWHLDVMDRQQDNYDIPGFAELEHDDDAETGVLENSFSDTQSFTLGGSWVGDNHVFGLSYGRLESDYGIPGHDHHHEEEDEDHEHEDEHHETGEHEEKVFARLQQDRYQAVADWKNLQGIFTEVHWHNAYTQYQHQEIEDEEVGTTFSNDGLESRLWANHKAFNGWQGVVGLHYNDSDFAALGEEAFTPDTQTQSLALFVLEEKRHNDLLWQLGARLEHSEITPDNSFFEHEEHDEGEEHEEDEIHFSSYSANALSLSAGVVWTVNDNSSWSVNLAHSQRAPSAAELFANGPHIGTGTFEIGGGFELHEEGEELHLHQADNDMSKESSNNLDISYRLQGEQFNLAVSLFYNQVDDFIFQQNTGYFVEGGELHAHDEDEHHEDEEHHDEHAHGDLPVFQYQQQDARLYGYEAELDWHFNNNWRLSAFSDYTHAKLDNGYAPRIPPMRVGGELHWENQQWHVEMGVTRYFKQDNIADYETETSGYNLVSASVNYYTTLGNSDIALFVKGQNLSDNEARVHSSFIKDKAPLPGRSIEAGIKVQF